MRLEDLTDEQIDEAAFRMAMEDTREELVREVEAKREARTETCPDCLGDGDAGRCLLCAGWGTVAPSLAEHRRTVIASPASALTRAWEAASGKDQVVS